MGERERGQASAEWLAAVAVTALLLFAGAAAIDASWLPAKLRCALLAACRHEDDELAAAYGPTLARAVRDHLPTIVYERGERERPTDFRSCIARGCSPPTVFTHVLDRRAEGEGLFIQYWLYFPSSSYLSVLDRAAGAVRLPAGLAGRGARLPGPAAAARNHRHDWESYQVWLAPSGRTLARASAHNGYRGRHSIVPNFDEGPGWLAGRRGSHWTDVTGFTRVSRGSHAGHLVERADDGPATAPRRVVLVPIERLDPEQLAEDFGEIAPPWRKPVYARPQATGT